MLQRVLSAVAAILLCTIAAAHAQQPSPLLAKDKPVDWFFAYKFNTKSFPGCPAQAMRACKFGGHVVDYKSGFGQQYAVASSDDPHLKGGEDCLGDTEIDPVGATFDQIYDGSLNFVVWNDQFYNDPEISGCGTSCPSPWGHSKGVLAWDDQGNGFVMQVTTPSWPGAGSRNHARADGNTLGCVNDDNVLVAQHFFALKLSAAGVETVARALATASVVTNPADPQIVNNGGPQQIRDVVAKLGTKSKSDQVLWNKLTPDIQLISKPAKIHAPPWYLVSSLLGSVNLRVATWWNRNDIPDTTRRQRPDCWPDQDGWKDPGAIINAQSGHWKTQSFGLLGIGNPSGNHAKIGVSTSGNHPYAIFGDLNQEGALSGACASKQNGRGGMFFVVENQTLHDEVERLISSGPGKSAREPEQ